MAAIYFADIGDKIKIIVNGKTRIPDSLTGTFLSEVKNVVKLWFTRQLRDYLAYAQNRNLIFDLYVRPSTVQYFSGPLQAAINVGKIILNFIPGAR